MESAPDDRGRCARFWRGLFCLGDGDALKRGKVNKNLFDPDLEIEVQRASLGLFLSGKPDYDTVISVTTDWESTRIRPTGHGPETSPERKKRQPSNAPILFEAFSSVPNVLRGICSLKKWPGKDYYPVTSDIIDRDLLRTPDIIDRDHLRTGDSHRHHQLFPLN